MDKKSLNPIYFWISENLLLENEISYGREDFNSFALTLTSYFAFSNSELSAKLKYLYQKLSNTHFNIRYSVAMSILLDFHSKGKISINSADRVQIQSTLKGIHNKSMVPLKDKLNVYYHIKNINGFDLLEYKSCLEVLRLELKQGNKLRELLEVEFSLGLDYYSRDLWGALDLSKAKFELVELSKLGLLYLELGQESKAKETLVIIENDVWNKVSDISLPTISLLIYEAEKLISTNLHPSKLAEILVTLKKQNKDWAGLITDIQKDGITVNLNKISRLSTLSPEENSWTLLLMERYGLKETYQLGEVEYNSFQEYQAISKKEKLPTALGAIQMYSLFIALLSLVTFLYFYKIGIEEINSYILNLNNLWDAKIQLDTIKALKSPFIIIPFIIRTYFNAKYYLVSRKNFGIKYFLISWSPWRVKI